jgi:branched-chain amino acid transport system ATP-binding protein
MMERNTSQPILSLQGVCKNFGGVKAVSDISVNIAYGERRLFLGTNGAGKTTLFNLIAGDLPVSSGKITLFGQDVTKMSVAKRVKLGMRRTYQTSELFNALTVRQNFYLALLGDGKVLSHLNLFKNHKLDYEKNKKVEEQARAVGIFEKLDEPVDSLSHGERRQVEFGLAIITEPKILLLDEPAAGLSEEEKQIMLKLIQSLDRSVTVVMIEHNIEMAFEIADYVTVMYDGKLFTEGTKEEIKDNEEVQRIYLGGSIV